MTSLSPATQKPWRAGPQIAGMQKVDLESDSSSRSISSPVGASRVGSFFPPKMYGVNTLSMRKRMCVFVFFFKKKELGCFLFRLLARVCVFACLWLRLGLCLHGAASVSLFAWCVPPVFFSIETAVGTSDLFFSPLF